MSHETGQSGRTSQATVSRRGLLRAAGTGAVVVGGGGLLEACSSGIKGASSGGTKGITIGWIHPLTGSLAGFGAPDNWVISKIKQTTPYKNGFKIGGKTYPVTIKSYDTQSSPTRAGDLAKTAILSDGVDLLFASSTPETVNAVASQAESLHTPLICANIPWESWYINLGGNPQKPTLKPKYVVMYFLGAEHLVKCFIPMWDRIHAQLHTNKVVAAAFPNDSDGNAFRAVFPPIATAAGYKLVLSPAYPDGTTNYSSMISQFKSAGADFFTNVPLPPDFATMWKQSVQQGFKPKLATVAKVLLFPPDAYALGHAGRQRGHRRLVGADAAVEVLVHRGDLPADGQRVRGQPRPVELQHQQLQPLRGRPRGPDLGERPARQGRGRRRHPQGEHPGAGRAAELRLRQTRARAWRSPRRSACNGRRGPSTRWRCRSSTTRCSRTRRSPPT